MFPLVGRAAGHAPQGEDISTLPNQDIITLLLHRTIAHLDTMLTSRYNARTIGSDASEDAPNDCDGE